MVLQRKGSLLLGLGLAVALVLTVSPTTASAVSTLTGEQLSGNSSSGSSGLCPSPTYSVSGTATGQYPGTFTEAGTWSITDFSSNITFTITSGTTTITGSKRITGGSIECTDDATLPTGASVTVSYAATIHTPSGSFHDEGVGTLDVAIEESAGSLTEGYTSSLTQPVPIGPTNKDQCKNNGWKAFPQFKNQGQCVSFVESKR
jgi:hypothetical protein